MPRVNYDQIAHLYDEPLRDHVLDPNLVQFLSERPDLAPARARILDIGCGTGKQLVANRNAYPDLPGVGIDLFAGMLRLARTREPTITWVQSDAARLPFASSSFDYATNQFSYHHVPDKRAFAREVFRVLRPGGRFVLVNIDPWGMPAWSLYRFFPAARDVDYRDFLPGEMLARLLREAGFADEKVTRGHRHTRESLADFLAYARQRFRASQLMALPDDEYRTGIRRLEHVAAVSANVQATIDSESCLLTIQADKS
jgi:SAM-dependent methyltransferase